MKEQISDMSAQSVKNKKVLPAGEYTGLFAGVYIDGNGNPWITVTSSTGAHFELSDLDVSAFKVGQRIKFTISTTSGVGVQLKGHKYRVWDSDTESALTKWTSLKAAYEYIVDNELRLAKLSLTKIESADE